MPINRIVLYVKDVEKVIAFYEKHFSFRALREPGDRIVELVSRDGGANLLIHPAAKGQKAGQSLVKLVFDVDDVEAFCASARKAGLLFGALHKGEGYLFANAKDPAGNPISVSGRATRKSK